MLAFNIYNYNLGAPATPIPLTGILVGNGCIGQAAGVCGSSPYGDYLSLAQFHGLAFLSDKAFEAANAACGTYENESPACRAAVSAASDEVGSNFDVYDLFSDMWGTCNCAWGRALARRAAALPPPFAVVVCSPPAPPAPLPPLSPPRRRQPPAQARPPRRAHLLPGPHHCAPDGAPRRQ